MTAPARVWQLWNPGAHGCGRLGCKLVGEDSAQAAMRPFPRILQPGDSGRDEFPDTKFSHPRRVEPAGWKG